MGCALAMQLKCRKIWHQSWENEISTTIGCVMILHGTMLLLNQSESIYELSARKKRK
jgi:hypothetical protein